MPNDQRANMSAPQNQQQVAQIKQMYGNLPPRISVLKPTDQNNPNVLLRSVRVPQNPDLTSRHSVQQDQHSALESLQQNHELAIKLRTQRIVGSTSNRAVQESVHSSQQIVDSGKNFHGQIMQPDKQNGLQEQSKTVVVGVSAPNLNMPHTNLQPILRSIQSTGNQKVNYALGQFQNQQDTSMASHRPSQPIFQGAVVPHPQPMSLATQLESQATVVSHHQPMSRTTRANAGSHHQLMSRATAVPHYQPMSQTTAVPHHQLMSQATAVSLHQPMTQAIQPISQATAVPNHQLMSRATAVSHQNSMSQAIQSMPQATAVPHHELMSQAAAVPHHQLMSPTTAVPHHQPMSQATAVAHHQLMSQVTQPMSQATAVPHHQLMSPATAVPHHQLMSQATAVPHHQLMSQATAVPHHQLMSQATAVPHNSRPLTRATQPKSPATAVPHHQLMSQATGVPHNSRPLTRATQPKSPATAVPHHQLMSQATGVPHNSQPLTRATQPTSPATAVPHHQLMSQATAVPHHQLMSQATGVPHNSQPLTRATQPTSPATAVPHHQLMSQATAVPHHQLMSQATAVPHHQLMSQATGVPHNSQPLTRATVNMHSQQIVEAVATPYNPKRSQAVNSQNRQTTRATASPYYRQVTQGLRAILPHTQPLTQSPQPCSKEITGAPKIPLPSNPQVTSVRMESHNEQRNLSMGEPHYQLTSNSVRKADNHQVMQTPVETEHSHLTQVAESTQVERNPPSPHHQNLDEEKTIISPNEVSLRKIKLNRKNVLLVSPSKDNPLCAVVSTEGTSGISEKISKSPSEKLQDSSISESATKQKTITQELKVATESCNKKNSNIGTSVLNKEGERCKTRADLRELEDSEKPVNVSCHVCTVTVRKEKDLIFHLIFGPIRCKNCSKRIVSCDMMKTLMYGDENCKKDDKQGKHHFTDWCTDAVQYLSYYLNKELIIKNFCKYERNTPVQKNDLCNELGEYLDKLLCLRGHDPWSAAMKLGDDFIALQRRKRQEMGSTNKSNVQVHNNTMPAHNSNMQNHNSKMQAKNSNLQTHNSKMPTNNSTMPAHNSNMQANNSKMPAHNSNMQTHDKKMPAKDSNMQTHDKKTPAKDSKMQAHNSNMQIHDKKMPAKDSEMQTHDKKMPVKDSKMQTHDKKMPAKDSKMQTPDKKMPAKDSKMQTHDKKMSAKDSKMQTPDKKMPAKDSKMQTPDKKMAAHNSKGQVGESKVLESSDCAKKKSDVCNVQKKTGLDPPAQMKEKSMTQWLNKKPTGNKPSRREPGNSVKVILEEKKGASGIRGRLRNFKEWDFPANNRYLKVRVKGHNTCCPEECPECYCLICPSRFIMNINDFTLKYVCVECSLPMFFIFGPDEESAVSSQNKASGTSKTKRKAKHTSIR